jgi:hypothetical protein
MNRLKEKQVIDLRNYNKNDKKSIFKRIYENNKKDSEDMDTKIFEIKTNGDIVQMIHYLLNILGSNLIENDIKDFEKIYNEAKS